MALNPIRNPDNLRASVGSTIRVPELPEVIPVAAALVKAIAAARLYPADNPSYLNAKKSLDEAISALLQLKRSVRFVVGRRTLFFAGEPVMSEEHGESVASCLHKDGIRELAFHRGLTPEETTGFLSLFIRSAAEEERASDDLCTLFWDRGFTHITCIVIDDFLDLEQGDEGIPTEFGQDFMPQIDLEVYDLEDEATVEQAAKEMSQKVLAKVSEDDVDLFGITEEEKSALLVELAAEEDPRRMRHGFARILIEVLLAEQDPEEFAMLIEVFEQQMTTHLEEANLRDLAWLLSVLVKIRAERPELPEEMSRAVEDSIAWLWRDDPRELLKSKLDDGGTDALLGLPSLVEAVPDDFVRHLCLLLGELETGRVRRRLIDLLVERCESSWTALLPLLSDSRWYLVRNVVLILGRVGGRLIAPSLHRALGHPDYRVRKEALIALDRLDPARAVSDLKDALGDTERRIRILAAQTLAKHQAEAAPSLLAIVTQKEFSHRSGDEILAFYTALAHAGGGEVLSHLIQVTKPRGLFRKAPCEEIRAAACRALGRMAGSEARRALETLLTDRSATVRESARLALEEAEGRTSEARNENPLPDSLEGHDAARSKAA